MAIRSRAYAWYVLALLTVINLVNYIDRQVITGMYDGLRAHFGLSNGQIGALTMAFFVVHALTTVPLGFAADRFDRRKILAASVIFWSLATLGSGYALGFLTLLLLRGAIGIGEAAYGPISNALLCEIFPPAEKARTVAIFNIGMFAGATIGIYLGGKLGFPTAFHYVAIPGLILGVMALFLDVPARREEPKNTPRITASAMLGDGFRALSATSLRYMLVAGVLVSFAAGGYITWFVDFATRYKDIAKPYVVFPLIALSGGTLGVIAGGVVGDFLQKRVAAGRTLAIALGFFLSVPAAVGAIYLDSGWLFYVSAWLLMFFLPFYNGPMAAVIDDVVPDRNAASAQASFSFVLHLCGSGPASFLVGLASDTWSLRTALLLPTVATAIAGVFCLLASRHVGEDMRSRARGRALEVSPAPDLDSVRVA